MNQQFKDWVTKPLAEGGLNWPEKIDEKDLSIAMMNLEKSFEAGLKAGRPKKTIYFVSLVYSKHDQGGTQYSLRSLVSDEPQSSKEALGHAIDFFVKEMPDYSLAMHTVVIVEPSNEIYD